VKTPIQTVVLLAAFASVAALGQQFPRTPPPVAPVTGGGIEYSAEGDGCAGYVIARDNASGKQLWKVEVFRYPQALGSGGRRVFIEFLDLRVDSVFVENDMFNCYSVNLKTRLVHKRGCGSARFEHSAR
jgi:hypothetical protein